MYGAPIVKLNKDVVRFPLLHSLPTQVRSQSFLQDNKPLNRNIKLSGYDLRGMQPRGLILKPRFDPPKIKYQEIAYDAALNMNDSSEKATEIEIKNEALLMKRKNKSDHLLLQA